ncbi:hypothetical protein [Rubinisphaera brasiliensis]|uniref:Uncharacterized protein n=1 Tax=Rubinisphaera brasiliensis (strain ATCC 49424 / DSM 5305 / JCM 21570 / IAM 15109 / NBRC 103401 / IFAM 1448) TaxID=756272 RepID=F0SSW6_RUBBR|nr:hypothetical protein [Rubinisphaera brasiliensis]ADY61444.1 hypothetical protein Plabr_3862 [Rubinisphaera brasiliensis DSM 5305]
MSRQFEVEVLTNGDKSYSQVAYLLGTPRTTVCYNMALLRRLPEEFVEWLDSEESQVIWAFFTEHRLRPITRLEDGNEKVYRLSAMIPESQELAQERTDSTV